MSAVSSISVSPREGTGKGAARAARRAGLIPGIVYGNKQTPVSVSIDPLVLWTEMNRPGFTTRLFDVEVAGKAERCLCRDVQKDPISDRPVHFDFMRVSADSKLYLWVPVHFVNQDKSPGLKRGGVLNVVNHEIEVICSPDTIPEHLVIDVEGHDIGHSYHLDVLVLPEGVVAASHEKGLTIATISAPTVAVVEEKVAAATEAAAATPAEGDKAPAEG
jgi:large subunit ribosomal protein L25